MKAVIQRALCAVLLGGAACASGDILELKGGTLFNGTYLGGTATTVRFETAGGVRVVETSQIIALTFTQAKAAPAAAPPKSAAASSTPVTLPAGTTLLVRMAQGISSKNAAGTPFTAKLEFNITESDKVVLKAGTVLSGKVQQSAQAGRALGRSTLDLRLTQVVLDGRPVPIVTSSYAEAGEASIKKAARGAAAGAAIGAIADGSDGAGTGAAIGATAGALKRGQTVTIAPGTLLEFTLAQSLTLQPAP